MVTLWMDERRRNAQQIIDWLLQARTQDGWPVDDRYVVALSELIYSARESQLTRGLAMKVLSQMFSKNLRTVSDFETLYEAERKRTAEANQKRIVKWRFFLPVDVAIDESLARPVQLTVSAQTWYFIPYQSLERALGKRLLRDHLHAVFQRSVDVNYGTFLSATSSGVTWSEAWGSLQPSFDLFRGWIEFTKGFGGFRILSSDQSPRRKVPHPPWLVAKAAGQQPRGAIFLVQEYPHRGLLRLTEDFVATLRRNIGSLSSQALQNSTESLLTDVLRLYAQAMDARYNYSCLLGLWQIAEAIAQPVAPSGNTDQIAKRLGFLGRETGFVASGWEYSLTAIGKRRNQIVHRGVQDVSEEEVTILKVAVDTAIGWLFHVRKRLPTRNHLEVFHRHRTLCDSALETIQAAAGFIRESRRVLP